MTDLTPLPQQYDLRGRLDVDPLRSFVRPGMAFDDLDSHPKGHLTINPEEIRLHVTDKSTVGWVDVVLHRRVFTSFDASFDSVAIQIDKIHEFLNNVPNQSSVAFTINTQTGRGYFAARNLSFATDLVVTEYVPSVDSAPRGEDAIAIARTSIEPQTLIPGIKLTQKLSELIVMSRSKDRGEITWRADGDGDSLRLRLTPDNTIRIRPADFEVAYPVLYLDNFIEQIPDGTTIQLAVTDTGRIVLRHPIADGHGKVAFQLKKSVRNPAD